VLLKINSVAPFLLIFFSILQIFSWQKPLKKNLIVIFKSKSKCVNQRFVAH
jgi:hypothetical protein